MWFIDPAWFIKRGPDFRGQYIIYFTHMIASILGATAVLYLLVVGYSKELVDLALGSLMWLYSGNILGVMKLYVICKRDDKMLKYLNPVWFYSCGPIFPGTVALYVLAVMASIVGVLSSMEVVFDTPTDGYAWVRIPVCIFLMYLGNIVGFVIERRMN
jgi:hypothetical protein